MRRRNEWSAIFVPRYPWHRSSFDHACQPQLGVCAPGQVLQPSDPGRFFCKKRNCDHYSTRKPWGGTVYSTWARVQNSKWTKTKLIVLVARRPASICGFDQINFHFSVAEVRFEQHVSILLIKSDSKHQHPRAVLETVVASILLPTFFILSAFFDRKQSILGCVSKASKKKVACPTLREAVRWTEMSACIFDKKAPEGTRNVHLLRW